MSQDKARTIRNELQNIVENIEEAETLSNLTRDQMKFKLTATRHMLMAILEYMDKSDDDGQVIYS